MARYSCLFQRTASTTLAVGSTTADATRPRRAKWYYADFGSEATPADNPFLWQVQRCTAAGTSTAVVPQPLDPADAATEFDSGHIHTVNPTFTAAAFVLTVPLNQRSTFRWEAGIYGELTWPATAAAGFGVLTVVSSAVLISMTVHVDEQ
jgi:hypothetical protein